MEEKYLKILIEGLNKKYGYKLEDLRFVDGLSHTAGLVEDLDQYSKKLIIFLKPKELSSIDFIKLKDTLSNKYNCISIDIYKVILIDKDEEYISHINQFNYVCSINNIQNNYVIIDYEANKILSYTAQSFVEQIADIMSYISIIKAKRKIPYGTYALMAINILVFIIMFSLSGEFFDFDIMTLIYFGAKQNALIHSGEYYRLFTCMFIHGGFMHLALNMYSLYSVGSFVEEQYGIYKYYGIYFFSGMIGSIFSYMFSDSVSVGASAAIFGLLGTILIYAISERNRIGKKFLRSVSSTIIVNFIIGFSIPNIDNLAHLGGFLGGTLFGKIAHMNSAFAKK